MGMYVGMLLRLIGTALSIRASAPTSATEFNCVHLETRHEHQEVVLLLALTAARQSSSARVKSSAA